MGIIDDLLAQIPDGKVTQVQIGVHWTAVVTEREGMHRCGLASTLHGSHEHSGRPDVPDAGQLEAFSGLELAQLLRDRSPLLRSVGGAAANSLLPLPPGPLQDVNAEEAIALEGEGKVVAIVGRFPFAARLRQQVKELLVLERHPQAGELPETAAPEALPRADFVAITGMTLLNHTLEGLLALCSPGARVLIVGPTTPLSPVLFNYGADMLSGSLVTDIEAVLAAVRQGANFRQVHRAGVRLVTLSRDTQF